MESVLDFNLQIDSPDTICFPANSVRFLMKQLDVLNIHWDWLASWKPIAATYKWKLLNNVYYDVHGGSG